MPQIPDRKLVNILRADGRYPPEAYAFLLNEVWPHAVRRAHGKDAGDPPGPGPMQEFGPGFLREVLQVPLVDRLAVKRVQIHHRFARGQHTQPGKRPLSQGL